MVKINKVYTKTGDKGETSLVGGRRILKDDRRIESYGTIDELNTVIGIARSFILKESKENKWQRMTLILQAIQQKLFDLGSELATHEEDKYEGQIVASSKNVKWLESLIDQINSNLDPLESFVLPGGDPINAYLHQARTVCRRAERQTLRFSRTTEINPQIIAFLNRLSDLLFVLARWASYQSGAGETLWQPDLELPNWEI